MLAMFDCRKVVCTAKQRQGRIVEVLRLEEARTERGWSLEVEGRQSERRVGGRE